MVQLADAQLSTVSAPLTPRPAPATKPDFVDTSKATFIGNIGNIGNALFKANENRLKAKGEAAAASVLADFTSKSIEIAEAIDTGAITNSEGRARSRALVQERISSNPELSGDLIKTFSDISKAKGLGGVLAEKSPEQQADEAARKSAREGGWTSDLLDRDQNEVGLVSFKRQQQTLVSMEFAQKEQALVNARLSGRSSSIALEQTTNKLNSRNNLALIATDQAVLNRNRVETVINDDRLSPQDKVIRINDIKLAYQQSVRDIAGDADVTFINNMTAPTIEMFDNALARADGTLDAASYKTQVDGLIAKQQFNMLNNSDRSIQAVAVSRLFPTSTTLALPIEEAALALMGQGQEKPGIEAPPVLTTPSEQGKKDVMSYLSMVKQGINDQLNGAIKIDNETHKEQVDNNLNNMFRSINAYALAVDSPSDYNELADFIATPSTGRYMEKEKQGLDVDAMAQAQNIMEIQYSSVLIPLIREEMSKQVVINTVLAGGRGGGVGRTQMSNLAQPVFRGSGVTFVLTQEGNENKNKAQMALQVQRMNRVVAPQVNKMIRISAHLSASTDYRKVWEEFQEQIFGAPVTAEQLEAGEE